MLVLKSRLQAGTVNTDLPSNSTNTPLVVVFVDCTGDLLKSWKKINKVNIWGSRGEGSVRLPASASGIVCHFLHEMLCEYYLTQLGSSDPYRPAYNSVYKL